MALVFTTLGLVDSSDLKVQDIVTMDDNARCYATEWYFGEEMVRRDVWVSALRPADMIGEQGG
jgi:hypothetical protein